MQAGWCARAESPCSSCSRSSSSRGARAALHCTAPAMSAVGCYQTQSRDIPGPVKRLNLAEGTPLPPGDYSTTPGGTVFGTTPGGTRIIYNRQFLMECRNSPVAKTPPRYLPDIPGVTTPIAEELGTETSCVHTKEEKMGLGEESQFDMDI